MRICHTHRQAARGGPLRGSGGEPGVSFSISLSFAHIHTQFLTLIHVTYLYTHTHAYTRIDTQEQTQMIRNGNNWHSCCLSTIWYIQTLTWIHTRTCADTHHGLQDKLALRLNSKRRALESYWLQLQPLALMVWLLRWKKLWIFFYSY